MTLVTWVAVGLVGGAGAVARVTGTLALGRGVPARGTLLVNLIGAFALGVLSGASVDGDARLLAGTAFLGAFTTFSTWMHETLALWDRGARGAAAGLAGGALLAGLAAVALGRLAGATL
jgi:CrcB protein